MSRQMPQTQGCIAIFKGCTWREKEQRLLHWHYCCRWIFCKFLLLHLTPAISYSSGMFTIESDRSLATYISTVFSSSNLLRIKKPPHNVPACGAKLRLYCNDLQGCTGRYKEQLPYCRTSLRKTWYSIRYKYYWSGPKLAMCAETWMQSHSGIAVT